MITGSTARDTLQSGSSPETHVQRSSDDEISVALLTGGGDRPYALGLADALISKGISFDFIGSDELDAPGLHGTPRVTFLNLRGDQRPDAGDAKKALRVLLYYVRLLRYAATAKPGLFHILWNNKFQAFDRTLLFCYYKLLGKKIAFTAHNVNAGKRDRNDSMLNRLTLQAQYRLSDHIFVHTSKMKSELMDDFRVPDRKVSVIPFGINNTVPTSAMTSREARKALGVGEHEKTLLFFGNIAAYKGLEYLVAAFAEVARRGGDYRLIIAGRPKGCEDYWRDIQTAMDRAGARDRILEKVEYIPEEEVEVYFKAADVLILPYTHIFQSGVLFLGYGFGLPAIASDVGSMKEDIIEGETGFVCRPQDAGDLARIIDRYFESELFKQLKDRRFRIQEFANERYSWDKVGEITTQVYAELLGRPAGSAVVPAQK